MYRKLALTISYVEILGVIQLVLKVTMGKEFFYLNLADSVILDISSRKSLSAYSLKIANILDFTLFYLSTFIKECLYLLLIGIPASKVNNLKCKICG